MSAAFDWLIIGGGIHGVHLAARLLEEARVAPDRLGIIDPASRLLARWRTCTHTTGMTHLRSPAVHHLDLDPSSLLRFAGRNGKRKPRGRGLFTPPYDRPALSLFNTHCDKLVQRIGLARLHIRERATSCSVGRDGIGVELSNGHEVAARNVVMAIGASEQPEWPDWAPRHHARVHHVFEPGFDGWPSSSERVIVIGGGISAAQVALRLVEEGHRVRLVSRHALRQHQFDSDPGWLGPKFMARFHRERSVERRRALITGARHKGSIPPDVRRALRRAIRRDQLLWHEAAVMDLDARRDGLRLLLTTRAVLEAERVLLATGFSSARPGGSMVDDLLASDSLPIAPCGYPIVDGALRWHRHLHVSGPLAELELGPAARNIAGARRAGDRLVEAARADA